MSYSVDENGDFIDLEGRKYVRCMADVTSPIYIDIGGICWECVWRGRSYYVDWRVFDLPEGLVSAAKLYLRKMLQKNCPREIYSVRYFLDSLSSNWRKEWVDFSSVTFMQLRLLWRDLGRGQKIKFRQVYIFCADNGLFGADELVAYEVAEWTDTSKEPYIDIIEWHETKGAMTSAEQELVRRAFMTADPQENHSSHLSRICIWLLFETLKRPCQLNEISKDALLIVDEVGTSPQYFIWIPKVKFQTGRDKELWPISDELAKEIISFSSRNNVSKWQQEKNILLVTNIRGRNAGMSHRLKNWVTKRALISPRTKLPLVLTPYRIRHSGATQMAIQGHSLSEIRYILEHDSPGAVKAYIDSVFSDLCPVMERVNLNLGGLFTELKNVFFKGRIESFVSKDMVLIPTVDQPSIVGSCGLNGRCSKHPFFNCYNGCRYFVAWREADHGAALNYIRGEFLKWSAVEGGNIRSKAVKDMERIYQSVLDVINRIESGE